MTHGELQGQTWTGAGQVQADRDRFTVKGSAGAGRGVQGMVRVLVDNDLGGIRESLLTREGQELPWGPTVGPGQGSVGSRFTAQLRGLPAGEGQAHLATAYWVALGGVLPLSGLGFPICRWRGLSLAAGQPSRARPSVPRTLCQSGENRTPGRASPWPCWCARGGA